MRWNYGKHSQSHYPDRDAGVPAGIFTPEPRAEIFSLSACRGAAFGHGGSAAGSGRRGRVGAGGAVRRRTLHHRGPDPLVQQPGADRPPSDPVRLRAFHDDDGRAYAERGRPDRHGLPSRPSTGRRRSDGRSPICVWPCRACTAGRIISPAFCGAGRRWPPPNTRPHGADAHGRLQSRTYLKNLGETSETRTAYEFSVSACERVPEFAIF